MTIKSGSQWFSITNDLAKYIVSNEKVINNMCKRAFCSDEVFLQTLVYNNDKFKANLYYQGYDDNYKANMRNIVWRENRPHVWTIEDYEELINSDYLFARKFDEKVDNQIIEKIYRKLKNET